MQQLGDTVLQPPSILSPRDWKSTFLVPSLSTGEVHVWRVNLEREQKINERHFSFLDQTEQAKARSFAFPHLRERYVTAHAVLRLLLASYLDIAPSLVRFQSNEYGKPAVAFPRGSDLQFNISHSHSLALYAFTRERPVGVDVEQVRPEVATLDLARTCFSPAEVTRWQTLPPAHQPNAFFQCWSRKEAYIKVRGMGLSMPLDSFDVALAPDEPCRLLRVAGEPDAEQRWSLYPLFPGPGYAGALAVEGSPLAIRLWDWSST